MSIEKIKTQSQIADIAEKEKAAGKTVGFTNGCFDILHLGHIRYLSETKKECDFLIIGVNGDSSVKAIKGDSRPINSQEARMELLASLECVDFVTLFEEDTPLELIQKITPNIIFKGGDWTEEEIAGADHVKAAGGRVRIIPYVEGHSTTEIIERLKS